tara:strand:- start:7721 stop:7936 length:216 start_codon:yes stop_codon:yes gene_type:complete
MYIIDYKGTKEEFCTQLDEYREKKSTFAASVNVPAPEAIFPVLKIVEDHIANDDYKIEIPIPPEEESDGGD